MTDKELTVKDLKEKIKDVPDYYTVLSEGCDCTGEAGDVDIYDDHKYIEIIRKN